MKIPNLHYAMYAAFCEDRLRNVRGLPARLYQRVHAPYALMAVGSKPCVLLPINRQYSPLGVNDENYVAYEPYASQAIRFHADPTTVDGIWYPYAPYLFDYSPAEKSDYVARLLKLASLAVSPEEAKKKLGLENGGRDD